MASSERIFTSVMDRNRVLSLRQSERRFPFGTKTLPWIRCVSVQMSTSILLPSGLVPMKTPADDFGCAGYSGASRAGYSAAGHTVNRVPYRGVRDKRIIYPDDREDSANSVARSEEHTSELQSHSFISYAVFCLKK